MVGVNRENRKGAVRAAIGFAAGDAGEGTAYALLGASGNGSVVRVPFHCRPLPALRGRDVAYAALTAVAVELRRRGIRDVVFATEDERLVRDLDERLPVPAPLAMPYVALRCELNRFHKAHVTASDEAAIRDLSARSRAEVFLQTAA
jgi:hypothetical protein